MSGLCQGMLREITTTDSLQFYITTARQLKGRRLSSGATIIVWNIEGRYFKFRKGNWRGRL
jgi:hypothetical protein